MNGRQPLQRGAQCPARLRELGIHTVLMAFDMDMYENPAVANCFQAIQDILREEGFQVKQIT